MTKTTVATWFVADDLDQASLFPQVPGRSSSRHFQNIYWRCVVTFFASCQRHTKAVDYALFTNAKPPKIGSFDIGTWLYYNGVNVVNVPIKRRLPKGAYDRWGNQFYVIDIIEHVANHSQFGDLLLFDSDCFWIGPVDVMVSALAKYKVLSYRLWYNESENLNGLSRRALTELYWEFFNQEPRYTLAYAGGEILAAKAEALERLAVDCSILWEANLLATMNNDKWCREEAQFLSLLYHKHGYEDGTANPFLKRIWTAPGFGNFRNTAENDRDLLVWHLPAEKRFGFRDAFRQVGDGGSRFWTTPIGRPFVDHAASTFGVGNKPFMRRARDFGLRIRHKLATKIES